MFNRIRLTQLLRHAAIALLPLLSLSAHAFNPQPEPPPGPALPVTELQTAAVSVVHPPDPGLSSRTLNVTLAFLGESGELIKAVELRSTPGQVLSLELSGEELGLRGTDRRRVYAIAQCEGGRRARAICASSIQTSVELYDTATGRTELVAPGGQALFFRVLQ